MFNIHCLINWNNIFWFLRYYKKNFSKQIVNLEVSTNSIILILIILNKLYKKNKIYSLKININSKKLKKFLIKKLDNACKKGPLFLLSVDFESKVFKDIGLLKKIRFPCLALNYKNKDKYGLFVVNNYETKKFLNALFIYYHYPFIDCEYSSCALKNIFIRSKKCSICKLIDMKKVITPYNIENIFINDENFINNLKMVVLRRKSCMIKCKNYTYCKGGCLLNKKNCSISELDSIVKNVSSYLDASNILKEMIIKKGVKK